MTSFTERDPDPEWRANARGVGLRASDWRPALALFAAVVAGAALQPALRAQFDANLGRILGEVTGPDGLVVPDAEVAIRGVESGLRRASRSDELGRFEFGSLRPGPYSVTAVAAGFARTTVEGAVVTVGSAVRADIRLNLSETFTEIEVSAAALDALLPASSNVVGTKVFSDLPINGRRFHDFALLTPGVQVSRAAGHLSFSAQRGIYTNVTVDGTDYNQAFFGGIQGGERAGAAMTVPQSAIQEFQAVTSGFTAEYGRTTAGVVNVSTKSGSNEFHGDAFFQARDPNLGLTDPFGSKVLERLRQFGGSAGGPLAANRAFWFAAVERQQSISPRSVEFPLLDGADRAAGPETYDYFTSLEEPFDATNDAIAVTPKVDYQFAGGSQLMARYNYSRGEGVNAVSIGDPRHPRTTVALNNNGTEEDSIHYLTAQMTGLLSPTLVNQLRFTVTREQRPRTPNGTGPSVSSAIGVFGAKHYLPTIETDIRPVISNSLIVHSGSHDVKIGGHFDRVWIDDVYGAFQRGTFYVFSADPEEILDILTPGGRIANRFDAPGIFLRQIGNRVGEQRLGHASLYVQDSWQAAPGLNLDLGFRWEAQFNQAPRVGHDVLLGRVQSARFPSGSIDPSYIPDSARQWMPRIGLAYSPARWRDRLVLRASAGVFYAVTPPVFLNDPTKSYRDPPFDLYVALPLPGKTIYEQFLDAGIDLNRGALSDLPELSHGDVAAALGGDLYAGASPTAVHGQFRNPRSIKYNVAAEFGLRRNMTAGVQWMRHSTSFLHGLRDYNIPASVVRPSDAAAIPWYDLSQRPEPRLSSVIVTESIGRADYNGISANWKRHGDRLQIVAHYTYARAYSSDINEGYFWGPLYTDQARPEAAYGPADLDMRHQLTAHSVLQLPWGVTWSTIVRATSGPPISPVAGVDLNGDQFGNDRALEAPGRFFGRNSFRNRAMRSADMRLLRTIRLNDRSSFELSLEVFNALNFENVEYGRFNRTYGPGVDLATGQPAAPLPSFLRLRGEGGEYDRNNTQVFGTGPLQLQLGVRFNF